MKENPNVCRSTRRERRAARHLEKVILSKSRTKQVGAFSISRADALTMLDKFYNTFPELKKFFGRDGDIKRKWQHNE